MPIDPTRLRALEDRIGCAGIVRGRVPAGPETIRAAARRSLRLSGTCGVFLGRVAASEGLRIRRSQVRILLGAPAPVARRAARRAAILSRCPSRPPGEISLESA